VSASARTIIVDRGINSGWRMLACRRDLGANPHRPDALADPTGATDAVRPAAACLHSYRVEATRRRSSWPRAGALERKIVGPIWLEGVLVTDLWIGDASDPPLESAGDVTRAMMLAALSGVVVAVAFSAFLLRSHWR
jgi:hypothetical protein